METPFKAIEFASDDVITRDTMDAMQANTQWLYENTPRGRFYYDDSGGKARAHRLVVVSGRITIPRNKKSRFDGKRVTFASNMFSPKCRPNVTTGIVASDNDIYCIVNGPDGNLLPGPTGFNIRVYVPTNAKDNWKISKEFYVNWRAIGYRENYVNDF